MRFAEMSKSVYNLFLAQSLDVISVNFWHVIVSLANLVLLFFVIKKFTGLIFFCMVYCRAIVGRYLYF